MKDQTHTSSFPLGRESFFDGMVALLFAVLLGIYMPMLLLGDLLGLVLAAPAILLGIVFLVVSIRFFFDKIELSDTAVAETSLFLFFRVSIPLSDIEHFAIHCIRGPRNVFFSKQLTVRKKDGTAKSILFSNHEAQAVFLKKMESRGMKPTNVRSL